MKVTFKGRFHWDESKTWYTDEMEVESITEYLEKNNYGIFECKDIDELAEKLHKDYEEDKKKPESERLVYYTPDNWYEIYQEEKKAKSGQ